jgi:hypothetical protein
VAASRSGLFEAFTGLGGERGWLYMNWAWRIRGMIDRLVGGVGLRRGRRDPVRLHPGEALDFWRVEAIEPDRSMRLRAEMKLPGEAWLEFRAEDEESGNGAVLVQTAYFAPKGLGGLLYWYGLYPVHALIFRGMIQAIAARASNRSGGRSPAGHSVPG